MSLESSQSLDLVSDETSPGRDWGGIAGGLCLVAIGVFFCIASTAYPVGHVARIGPGFFPLILSVLVAVLGAVISIIALKGPKTSIPVAWRPFVAIIGAVLVFYLTIDRLGLATAVFLSVLISSLGERPTHLVRSLVVAIACAVISVAVFIYGLQIPVPPVQWNF